MNPIITLQYLEYSPQLAALTNVEAVDRLRSAFERLPFTHLLVGWNIPPRLAECCRVEADRLGVHFLRWQPLLTSDGDTSLDPAWRVVGPLRLRIKAFNNLPDFIFGCPNHPGVQERIERRVDNLVQEGLYQGFFLDRVRFPSPSADPAMEMGCFCEYCQQKAAHRGLDLEFTRRSLIECSQAETERIGLVRALLSNEAGTPDERLLRWLKPFMQFRQDSVSDLVQCLFSRLHDAQLEVGLDCFTPSLASMVGQDLGTLSRHADWVKLMTYAHTYGPAGIPFELAQVFDYLSAGTSLKPDEILHLLAKALDLDLPTTRDALVFEGLSPSALAHEIRRGVQACSSPVLAGIELVELQAVTHLHREQVTADLQAIKSTGSAGLSISWDLLHIPLDRLRLARQAYLE